VIEKAHQSYQKSLTFQSTRYNTDVSDRFMKAMFGVQVYIVQQNL
jgi:hypothetical protein